MWSTLFPRKLCKGIRDDFIDLIMKSEEVSNVNNKLKNSSIKIKVLIYRRDGFEGNLSNDTLSITISFRLQNYVEKLLSKLM